MKPYSAGSGASPPRNMTASLPSCSSASPDASSEPRASPSGFSCVVSRKRSCVRIASATAERSLGVVWGELIDELRHAHAALDGGIVFEGQLRGPLHSQLPCDPPLEDAVRCLESFDRLLPLALASEHADED